MCKVCGSPTGHDFWDDLCPSCGNNLDSALEHSKSFGCTLAESLKVYFGELAGAAAAYIEEE